MICVNDKTEIMLYCKLFIKTRQAYKQNLKARVIPKSSQVAFRTFLKVRKAVFLMVFSLCPVLKYFHLNADFDFPSEAR